MILLCAVALATACSDDDTEVFAIKPTGGVSFSPFPGGAIMTYTLPANPEIAEIRARYTDVNGKEVIVTGSYQSREMTLEGFNEARTNIPIYIAYVDKNGLVSEEYETTFSTGDSGPYAFFNTAEVKPAWNGFELEYELPEEGMKGFAHVFYVGVNPNTQKADTLLVSTITLQKGKESVYYRMQQDIEETTVVIKTEDFRGYFVKQQEWKNVKSYATRMMEPSSLAITCDKSVESTTNGLGIQYLTDGDTKGVNAYSASAALYYTFVMGPYATGTDIIVDLGQPQVPASIRWYAQMHVKSYYTTKPYWYYNYTNTLPCEVTLYGSNDKSNWTKLGYYTEPQDGKGKRWFSTYHLVNDNDKVPLDVVLSSDPVYLEIGVSVSEDTYRYLRIVPEKTFDTVIMASYKNTQQYVTMQELEVYVKK